MSIVSSLLTIKWMFPAPLTNEIINAMPRRELIPEVAKPYAGYYFKSMTPIPQADLDTVNAGIKGKFTEQDLPKINPLKLNEVKKKILDYLNSIPPYYTRYTGRDQSVPEKESVLHPKFPLDTM